MPPRGHSIGTATLLIVLTVLSGMTGCGSDGGDADDVPTITTRPSTSDSSSPTTGEPSASAPESSVSPPIASVTTPPAGSETPTETGPSPEPPTDQPVGPTTYRQALAQIRESRPPIAQPLPRFSTHDEVIYCLLDDPVIGPSCELSRGFIEDDRVCGGAAEGVGRIETFEGRARPVCPTDTIREPGAEVVLGDGVVSNGDGVECLVDATSVTCIDSGARTGFFLAPGEYHVF